MTRRLTPLVLSQLHSLQTRISRRYTTGSSFGYNDLTNLGSRREKINVHGIDINWDAVGRGEHVVLCFPGVLGFIEYDFGPVFEKMNKEKFTFVSFDPPGYGRSRLPGYRNFSGVFSRRDAFCAADLMEKLGHSKYSIMGWSNGSLAVCHLAGIYPNRIRSLVTWGCPVLIDERVAAACQAMENYHIWPESMKKKMLAMYDEEYLTKTLRDWGLSVRLKRDDQIMMHLEINHDISQIKCPALIIHNENNVVSSMLHANILLKNIKKSSFYLMKGEGHNVHLKSTEKFIKVVEKFLIESQLV